MPPPYNLHPTNHSMAIKIKRRFPLPCYSNFKLSTGLKSLLSPFNIQNENSNRGMGNMRFPLSCSTSSNISAHSGGPINQISNIGCFVPELWPGSLEGHCTSFQIKGMSCGKVVIISHYVISFTWLVNPTDGVNL